MISLVLCVDCFDFVFVIFFGHEQKHNGITTVTWMSRNLVLGPKRIGKEADTVYVKSFPEFASILQFYHKHHRNGVRNTDRVASR